MAQQAMADGLTDPSANWNISAVLRLFRFVGWIATGGATGVVLAILAQTLEEPAPNANALTLAAMWFALALAAIMAAHAIAYRWRGRAAAGRLALALAAVAAASAVWLVPIHADAYAIFLSAIAAGPLMLGYTIGRPRRLAAD